MTADLPGGQLDLWPPAADARWPCPRCGTDTYAQWQLDLYHQPTGDGWCHDVAVWRAWTLRALAEGNVKGWWFGGVQLRRAAQWRQGGVSE